MNTAPSTVSELAFLLKLLPLFQEVDSVDRLYRLLLAIATSGDAVGYRRAILLGPDEQGGVIRGRYGAERVRPARDGAGAPDGGFNEMARAVFRNYEQLDASDMTVRARSYSVPLGWHRSAIVKALRTRYPVLAERGTSEFATDTFFEFFGVTSYIAIPVEVDGRVTAVLAVDRSARDDGSAEVAWAASCPTPAWPTAATIFCCSGCAGLRSSASCRLIEPIARPRWPSWTTSILRRTRRRRERNGHSCASSSGISAARWPKTSRLNSCSAANCR